jgi:hypothetical protein
MSMRWKREPMKCDSCKKDFSHNQTGVDWYIKVESERIPNKSMLSSDILKEPPIPRALYFCGLGCLRNKLQCISDIRKEYSKQNGEK